LALQRRAEESGRGEAFTRVLTFENVLADTPLAEDLREMLAAIQSAYEYPVDTEFTVNFFARDRYKIDLVQCRPLQVASGGTVIELPEDLRSEDCVLEAHGAVIGRSRLLSLERFVYVVPSQYGRLTMQERYAVARLIGRLLHQSDAAAATPTFLIGPGRWGTSSPSLGVPVAFAEISAIAALCEIVAMRDDLIPDVSLGTHFFNELVEMDILYTALFPGRPGNRLNSSFFEQAPNQLVELLPDALEWADVVRVGQFGSAGAAAQPDGEPRTGYLHADALKQQVTCYLG
jgi:pyruvate,water dikinase